MTTVIWIFTLINILQLCFFLKAMRSMNKDKFINYWKRERIILEIDEAKIGKRKYNKGWLVEGQRIFSGIERSSKQYL